MSRDVFVRVLQGILKRKRFSPFVLELGNGTNWKSIILKQ
jgi:hypothetical protein